MPDTLTALLPLATATPGAPVQLAGFEQDRAERLVVDPACTLLGLVRGTDQQPLLHHTCNGTRGVSGGALVVQTGPGTWGLAGMAIAAQVGGAGGYAIPTETLRALLP